MHVRVKRAIKGVISHSMVLVVNDTCGLYVRRSYTGIFMARKDHADGRVVMVFGPLPLTLSNLDRLNAAVRGKIGYLGVDDWGRRTYDWIAFV